MSDPSASTGSSPEFQDEYRFICDACGEWFVHPNGVAQHAAETALHNAQYDGPCLDHSRYSVYQKVA